jgi:flagellar export protein FliJ
MNWTTLLKFRKQVEDMAREEVVLAEWDKSQAVATRDDLSREMETVVAEFEQQIQAGMENLVAEERYRWLEHIGSVMEEHTEQICRLEGNLEGLRQALKKAYQARRVVELVIEKKESAVLQKIAAQEQRLQDDLSAHAFATCHLEEMTY